MFTLKAHMNLLNFDFQFLRRILLPFVALLVACGGGSGGSSSSGGAPLLVAPVLSNLAFSPAAAYVNSGGGTVTVTGTVTVAGANSGVASVTISVVDASGATVSSNTTDVVGGAAVISGVLQGTVTAGTSAVGNYSVRVSLVDKSGLTSNTLTGNFKISANPWSSYAAMPNARTKFALAAANGLAYVFGGELMGTGITPGPDSALVEVFNPVTNAWTSTLPLPTARKAPTAAAVNGVTYVIGGYNLEKPGGLGVVEAFDTNLKTWSTKAPMPTVRFASAAAVVNGLICVVGGQSAGQDLTVTECFDPLANAWMPKNGMPTFRSYLAADTLDGKILAVGGLSSGNLSGGGPGVVATTESFDFARNAWSSLASMATPREAFAACSSGGLLYAFGGGNALSRTLQTVEAFDPASSTWKVKTDMPTALAGLAAVNISGVIYVFDQSHSLAYTPANELP
jgi:N-acetylneuraminic acid mutarotase